MTIVENSINNNFQSEKVEDFCKCGNTPTSEGFERLDQTAQDILFLYDPDFDGGYSGRYVCERCGRILQINEFDESFAVVGVMQQHRLSQSELEELGPGKL